MKVNDLILALWGDSFALFPAYPSYHEWARPVDTPLRRRGVLIRMGDIPFVGC